MCDDVHTKITNKDKVTVSSININGKEKAKSINKNEKVASKEEQLPNVVSEYSVNKKEENATGDTKGKCKNGLGCKYLARGVCRNLHNFHTASTNETLSCEKCNKSFRDKWVMKRHFRTGIHLNQTNQNQSSTDIPFPNTNETPSCEKCNKSFRDKWDMKRHFRRGIHLNQTNQNPSTTNIPFPSFRENEDKPNHPKLNTSGPIICEVCRKTFPNPCRLIKHMVKHSDEKPYECNICHVRFKRIEDLKKHRVKIHKLDEQKKQFEPTLNNKIYEQAGAELSQAQSNLGELELF